MLANFSKTCCSGRMSQVAQMPRHYSDSTSNESIAPRPFRIFRDQLGLTKMTVTPQQRHNLTLISGGPYCNLKEDEEKKIDAQNKVEVSSVEEDWKPILSEQEIWLALQGLDLRMRRIDAIGASDSTAQLVKKQNQSE